jgi:hypothetical protein
MRDAEKLLEHGLQSKVIMIQSFFSSSAALLKRSAPKAQRSLIRLRRNFERPKQKKYYFFCAFTKAVIVLKNGRISPADFASHNVKKKIDKRFQSWYQSRSIPMND